MKNIIIILILLVFANKIFSQRSINYASAINGASAYASSNYIGYEALKAIDSKYDVGGSEDSWLSATPDSPQWIIVEFANPTNINQIICRFSKKNGDDNLYQTYEIQVFENNAWITKEYVSPNVEIEHTSIFPLVTTKKIRCYFTKGKKDRNYSMVTEIEVYNTNVDNNQQVISDNTAPEIVVYEPSVSRGHKIVEVNKQIFVKGKATDNIGIYEVTINGADANVNANGYFQQNVKLAIGDNTIIVKATDTKDNTATYTFYVNRQEVINNDNIINDNPININEKRLALVIGNSNYGGGQTLKNPANDANLMTTTLQNLGFEVIKRIDANKQSMEQAIRDFSKKLPNCNVALFYYAGHGLQVDGLNYLVPTDAKLNDKSDCKFEAISVNYVVEEFEKYPNNVNVVILDACRNDPFRSWARGGERGFKAIAPTSGTIISFATSEGSTASDGTGNNGLFTEQLVKQMYIPQPIESVFKKTRVEVEQVSNGAQSPQEWSKLKGDFYFKK